MAKSRRDSEALRAELRYRNHVDPVATAERLEQATERASETLRLLSELTRTAHESVQEVKEARKEVEKIWATMRDDLHDTLQKAVTTKVELMHKQMDVHIDQATAAIYERFDTVGDVLMGENERERHRGTPSILELAHQLRARWDEKPSEDCYHCGRHDPGIIGFMEVGKNATRQPVEGDVKVCTFCRTVLVFAGDGNKVRRPTFDEMVRIEAHPDMRVVMDAAVDIIDVQEMLTKAALEQMAADDASPE